MSEGPINCPTCGSTDWEIRDPADETFHGAPTATCADCGEKTYHADEEGWWC